MSFQRGVTRILSEFFSVSHLRLVIRWCIEILSASSKKFYASESILNEMGSCETPEYSPES